MYIPFITSFYKSYIIEYSPIPATRFVAILGLCPIPASFVAILGLCPTSATFVAIVGFCPNPATVYLPSHQIKEIKEINLKNALVKNFE